MSFLLSHPVCGILLERGELTTTTALDEPHSLVHASLLCDRPGQFQLL